jgi:hypothetical protein
LLAVFAAMRRVVGKFLGGAAGAGAAQRCACCAFSKAFFSAHGVWCAAPRACSRFLSPHTRTCFLLACRKLYAQSAGGGVPDHNAAEVALLAAAAGGADDSAVGALHAPSLSRKLRFPSGGVDGRADGQASSDNLCLPCLPRLQLPGRAAAGRRRHCVVPPSPPFAAPRYAWLRADVGRWFAALDDYAGTLSSGVRYVRT